jgi:prepilin signal peptidase PulO-like enzyme (type II secretory pathway)
MIVLHLLIVLTGLVSGSFLFTIVHRLPKNESLWKRSACDHCGQTIGVIGLIPIVGYLVSLGKCPSCKNSISKLYPSIELLNAVWVYTIFLKTGWTPSFISFFLIFETLLLIAILDFHSFTIFPQPVIFGLLVQSIHLAFADKAEIVNSLIGLFIGAGIFHWISYLYQTFRNKVGLGEGDATLLGLIGFCFGWNFLFATIFWGAILGIIGGGFLLIVRRQSLQKEIAFAPWLVLATFLVWYFPEFFKSIPFDAAGNLFFAD